MKRYLLILFFLSCIVFSWCWNNKGNLAEEQTWENISWSGILNDMLSDIQETTETVSSIENNQAEEMTWEQEGNEEIEEQTVWETMEQVVNKQSRFWVDECNRIIDFDLCIIDKAPIENQPVMKESLQSAIESWKIMANAQLREVCKDIEMSNSFQEVVAHYGGLDNWCIY